MVQHYDRHAVMAFSSSRSSSSSSRTAAATNIFLRQHKKNDQQRNQDTNDQHGNQDGHSNHDHTNMAFCAAVEGLCCRVIHAAFYAAVVGHCRVGPVQIEKFALLVFTGRARDAVFGHPFVLDFALHVGLGFGRTTAGL